MTAEELKEHDDSLSMNAIGDVMKKYEEITTSLNLIPNLPVYARIDGRAFHTFCHGLTKPFDKEMMSAMSDTCEYLVSKTQAAIGYVQSDEISLAWVSTKNAPFDGRLQKLTSVLAGMASSRFMQYIYLRCGDKMMDRAGKYVPHFDCRVCNLPSIHEVEMMFKWREMDAYRNAVNSVAQANFSHNQLQGKNLSDVHEMLFQKGINFTRDFTVNERHGTFYARVNKEVPIPADILAKIPAGKRPQEGATCIRTFVEDMKVDSFAKLHDLVMAKMCPAEVPALSDKTA